MWVCLGLKQPYLLHHEMAYLSFQYIKVYSMIYIQLWQECKQYCHEGVLHSISVKNLVGGRTYYFRVLANSATSYESSEEVKFPVPARVKHKAITAGVVGGILFFIVAIILSVCAVKICNKRKRRKQEKGKRVNGEAAASPLHSRNSSKKPRQHIILKKKTN